jgi:uncharacterized protein YdaU (DUF1376 family)
MNYYPHHIGDFVRDTSRLSDSQCMAYLRLIWLYYESEQPLANDVQRLAFQIGSDEKTVELLLQCFFYANAERWHHKRIDAEIEAYKTKSIKASESAKARWKNAKDMRTHSEGNANQEPITNNQKPITKNQEEKRKEKKQTQGKPARFDPLAIPLPDCIKPSAWESWIEYRRARKLTCAEPTMKSQLQNLEAWWNEGHEPNSIMQASITNGWQGLFAPKLPFESKPVEDTSETNRRLAELVSRKFNLVGGGS